MWRVVRLKNWNRSLVKIGGVRHGFCFISASARSETDYARDHFIKVPLLKSYSILVRNSFGKENGVNNQWLRWYATGTVEEKIIKTPTMADSITEGELARWEKDIGDNVKENDVVCVIETDKVDIEVPSPLSGILIEVFAKPGDTVKVGGNLFKLKVGGNEVASNSTGSTNAVLKSDKGSKNDKKEDKKVPSQPTNDMAKAEPSTKGVTDPKMDAIGRDVSSHAVSQRSSMESLEPASSQEGTSERRIKMSRMRLRIAERLKESQNIAAALTTFNEIDMTNLMELRSKYKDDFLKKHNIKFGFMSAFVRAATIALQEIPEVNASIDGSEMVYHDYVDISVAVATPKGLVTPIIRNCETMSYLEIEKAINQLGEKARSNQITIDDMAGGTFTISNGGVFGSLMGTPIINQPQSAILGMHSIKDRPVVVNGQIQIRPMMYVALTYDHRLIDGREAVTFLNRCKELVEDPRRLLLDL